jgi:formiminotetrahydrofolate cyclodeaminase
MSFQKDSLKRFTDRLGSKDGSPGGGAAAALTGSLGVSLVEMVMRINNRRSVEKSTAAIEKTKALFLDLMDRDAKAFKDLTTFSKEERAGAAYQKALRRAAEVPMKAAESVLLPLVTAVLETNRTSTWLFSDLLEAGLLLEAAFLAARLNVEINLKMIHDKKYVNACRAKLDKIQTRTRSLVKKINAQAKK